MATSDEVCANCGASIKAGESQCPQCGTAVPAPDPPRFNWEPSEPSLAHRRNAATAQKGMTKRVSGPPASTLTTAGIIILATISAFSFWFSVSIGVIGIVNEPYGSFREGPSADDYFSGGRVLLSFVTAAVLTAITWAGALTIAEQRQ